MFTFKPGYFLAAVALFVSEVLIALYCHGGFLRLYFGDYLVVILIYCVVRAFTRVSVPRAAAGVLVLSFGVEVSQYFHLIDHLGLASSKAAHLILGSYFEWNDLVAYTCGIGTVLLVERAQAARRFPGCIKRIERWEFGRSGLKPPMPTKRKALIWVFRAIFGLVVLGVVLPIFGNVTITTASINFPIVITRNGQEVSANQIHSVRYLFGRQPSHSPQDIETRDWREARADDGLYLISGRSAVRRSSAFFSSTEIDPDYRSVALRVQFTDDKVFSLSFPVIQNRRMSGTVYVDFNDAQP